VPSRDAAVDQQTGAFAGRKLLLDGQQRLTSLTSVIRGQSVSVRGRKKPIDILFNLDHPDGALLEVTEVDEDEESPTSLDDEISDEDLDVAVVGPRARPDFLAMAESSRRAQGLPRRVQILNIWAFFVGPKVAEVSIEENRTGAPLVIADTRSPRPLSMETLFSTSAVASGAERSPSRSCATVKTSEAALGAFSRPVGIPDRSHSRAISLASSGSVWPVLRAVTRFQVVGSKNST